MKLRHIKRGLQSPFVCIKRRERGFLIVEALVTFVMLAIILTMLTISYANTSPVRTILETSQDFQMREYTKLYDIIAPDVAKTLKIGESVVFETDSPNYLTSDGKKFINLFEDYKVTPTDRVRENLTETLVIYNVLHNMSNITVTRSGINTYACKIKFTYYDYKDFKQFRYPLNVNDIENVNGKDYALFARGIPYTYEFSTNGEIVPQSLKN